MLSGLSATVLSAHIEPHSPAAASGSFREHVAMEVADDVEMSSDYSTRRASGQSSLRQTEAREVSRSRQLTVLLSAFGAICTTIGINQSYGVFQAAYVSQQDSILDPNTPKNTALIAFVGILGLV